MHGNKQTSCLGRWSAFRRRRHGGCAMSFLCVSLVLGWLFVLLVVQLGLGHSPKNRPAQGKVQECDLKSVNAGSLRQMACTQIVRVCGAKGWGHVHALKRWRTARVRAQYMAT